jgi:ABC-type transport system involved in cytochrome c biogenesis permease subunit
MNSAFALSSTTLLYGLAMVCYVGAFAFKKKTLAKAGFYVLAAGFLANTAGIGLRWVESYQMGIGRAPFSNMYE